MSESPFASPSARLSLERAMASNCATDDEVALIRAALAGDASHAPALEAARRILLREKGIPTTVMPLPGQGHPHLAFETHITAMNARAEGHRQSATMFRWLTVSLALAYTAIIGIALLRTNRDAALSIESAVPVFAWVLVYICARLYQSERDTAERVRVSALGLEVLSLYYADPKNQALQAMTRECLSGFFGEAVPPSKPLAAEDVSGFSGIAPRLKSRTRKVTADSSGD